MLRSALKKITQRQKIHGNWTLLFFTCVGIELCDDFAHYQQQLPQSNLLKENRHVQEFVANNNNQQLARDIAHMRTRQQQEQQLQHFKAIDYDAIAFEKCNTQTTLMSFVPHAATSKIPYFAHIHGAWNAQQSYKHLELLFCPERDLPMSSHLTMGTIRTSACQKFVAFTFATDEQGVQYQCKVKHVPSGKTIDVSWQHE